MRQQARETLPSFRAYLRPAYPEETLALVTATMNFFFTRAEDDGIAEIQAELWLAVLGTLPLHAIARACEDWLRTSTKKRPTPADIYQRASAVVDIENRRVDLLNAVLTAPEPEPDVPPPTEEEKAAVAQAVARFKATLTQEKVSAR